VQLQLIEAAANAVSAQLTNDQLASTGGESLSLVWWVGAGLLVVGVAVGVIAFLRRRRASDEQVLPVDTSDDSE
jgi:hypothetical protein